MSGTVGSQAEPQVKSTLAIYRLMTRGKLTSQLGVLMCEVDIVTALGSIVEVS